MNYTLPPVDDTAIWDIWLSVYQVPAISVAIDLELFESLDSCSDSAAGLARRRNFDARALGALLPMLKKLGLLVCHDGLYALSETGRHYMLKSSPYFWGGLFTRVGKTLAPYTLLLETVNGERANAEKSRPADGWESGHVDMELARTVTAFMHSHSMAAAVGLSKIHDFSWLGHMLDIGGGSGCFSIAVAASFPEARCTVMELPTICRLANGYIEEAGVQGQVDTLEVDMFRQEWPENYDAHFFSNIFHDWSPETCLDLARKSLDCLLPGGKILLHEMLLDDNASEPAHAVTFSLLMAMGTKGQQFTYPQLRKLLELAGFHDIQRQPAYGYYSLVSGVKR